MSSRKAIVVAAVVLAWLVGVPLGIGDRPYDIGVLTTASALSVISAGVWLMFYIGRIHIGQGAFALLGQYAAAIAITKLGLSFWVALPLAGLVAALFACAIGFPILRLKGVYFAMVTLSLTEAARLSAQSFASVTNGPKGILNIPLPGAVEVYGLTLVPDFSEVNPHVALFCLATLLAVATYAALYRIVNSRLGWLFRSLQQNEDLASSIGVNVARLRVIAFAIGSFLGGVGGAFFLAVQQSVYPSSFQVQDSIYLMLYCFLGGLGYVFGPLVGTFVLVIAFEFLHGLNEYQPLIYALLMIGLMLWLPNGLLSLGRPGGSAPGGGAGGGPGAGAGAGAGGGWRRWLHLPENRP